MIAIVAYQLELLKGHSLAASTCLATRMRRARIPLWIRKKSVTMSQGLMKN